jgi:hypothetical protein
MSVFAAIARLVHHYDFLPIEFVCYVLTGTSGTDDVTHSYSDASWKVRNRAYDEMSPEEIRAAARAARQTCQLQGFDEVTCSAIAVIAAQDSTAFNSMHKKFQGAVEGARKRKLEVLQDNEAHQEGPIANPDTLNEENFTLNHSAEDVENACGDDDEFMAFLGLE